MSDENKPLNDKDKKRLEEGRGKGTGENYIPFIKVGEFSGSGESIRVKSRVAKRIHHFHSGIELSAFIVFDWHSKTSDIREQFPIPLNDSLSIAKELGIRHPQIRGELSIVTTDLFVDFFCGQSLAIAVKSSSELNKKRIVEKLQIEKAYWEQKGYDWRIFTEKDISDTIKENIAWLRSAMSLDDHASETFEYADLVNFLDRISNYKTVALTKLCGRLDDLYELEPGFHISLMRYGIAHRIFLVSLSTPYYALISEDLKLNPNWYQEQAYVS
ncbi:TnsA endonuclease N-terminal domain-containing protein [Catenovulum sp. 2E275]|uniref:TnsA endonuclease N-terminal domain-containing protein n=1 Tax=Catenovulum sp. 2E275 TaxID=2980497 RepID=UPI0021D22872|nr:TnsA endonuclease N-terminal domain-containing protein [Catenovulum sp. 2E275]MCU4676208.1 TnsA endonuclease N-terminal domain-containing protein [Catenovulum sp. 2E275]